MFINDDALENFDIGIRATLYRQNIRRNYFDTNWVGNIDNLVIGKLCLVYILLIDLWLFRTGYIFDQDIQTYENILAYYQ
jgi:hypothetical protein